MITYEIISKESEENLQLPNEPFEIFGQLIVTRSENEWAYETKLFDQTDFMVFPAENYSFDAIDEKGFAFGAYMSEKCVGLAIFEYSWNKTIYLMDLKVTKNYRRKGIAHRLIHAGKERAKELNFKGIYTIAQDNNLGACQFYLKSGFSIGGFNTMDYRHTAQKDKADVYFYQDFE